MAKGERIEKKGNDLIFTVYFGTEHTEVLDRFDEVAREFKNISISSMIVTCMEACIETLEKEVPRKRRFTLNGVEVDV